MSLKGLIFDVDGTLAETEEIHRLAFNDAFAAAGIDWVWDRDLYRELLAVTGGKERIRLHLERIGADLAAFPAERIAALHRDKNEHFIARLRAGACPLRPGVEPLLRQARAEGVRTAVATTTSRVNIEALIAAHFRDEPSPFDTLVTGEDVSAKKPNPEAYRLALARLGLPAADCLAVEDTAIGLTAARGAGLATVVTLSFYGAGEDFDGAVAVLPDLGGTTLDDLRDLLARSQAGERPAGV